MNEALEHFPGFASNAWLLGALAAALVGVAKTGVPGFGIMAVPLMVLAADSARVSAGWLLPLLCVADLFAVAYYRHHAQAREVLGLLPWVVMGMGLGTWALGMDDQILRYLVATIVLAMLLLRVHAMVRAHTTATILPAPTHWLTHATYGLAAGFATTVANAAGPIMILFLLARRLPKERFMATQAWFFLAINFSKLPIYGARNMLTPQSLLLDASWLPAVALGAILGRVLFLRIPQRLFNWAVLGLTAAATGLLYLR